MLFIEVERNSIEAGSVLLVYGCIPVALSNSEGAGSVWVLAQLSGTHLYIQVLGNEKTQRLIWSRHFLRLKVILLGDLYFISCLLINYADQ